MPRLVQRSDGCFFVRHFHRDNTTWQVDDDGVRYLRDRGVHVNELFSTDMFMDMLRLKFLYTLAHPRESAPKRPTT